MRNKIGNYNRTTAKIYCVMIRMISIFSFISSFTKSTQRSLDLARSSSTSINNLFYQQLGNPKTFSAPMVDQSELAWRLLARSNGADLCFTQMILAKQFLIAKDYRHDCMDWLTYELYNESKTKTFPTNLLLQCGITEEMLDVARKKASILDKTLIVQVAGDNVETLIKAGEILQSKAAAIDLNLGIF